MKQFLFNLSFRNRIWLTFVILVIFTVSLTGTISYHIASSVIKNNTTQSSQQILSQTVQVLDERLRRVVLATRSLIISDPFNNMMKDNYYKDTKKYHTHLSNLQTPFMQMKINEPIIQSALIATQLGDFYPTTFSIKEQGNFFETEMYERIKEKKRAIWVEGHEDPFFLKEDPVLSFVVEGISTQYSSPIDKSYVVVNIREEALKKVITNKLNKNNSDYFLLTPELEPVFSLDRDSGAYDRLVQQNQQRLGEHFDEEEQGSFEFDVKGETYFINYTKSQIVEDWILLQIVPKSVLLAQLDSIKWTTILISIGGIILVLIAAHILTKVLLRPLHHLEQLMKKAGKNDLNVRFKSPYHDEVTQVGRQFNRMISQIKSLISDIKKIEKEKRKTELKVLQAQMNPHFLYNILNTLYWKSQMEQKDDVSEMLLSLSEMIKLGLNYGKEITTVHEELDHVQKYMELQQKCYEDLFDYRIDVQDERLRQKSILKLLLQPLVENAILHGLPDNEEKGMISIRVYSLDEQLVLEVKDNGCGMDIDKVLTSMRQEKVSYKGYALRNIYNRLQLHYRSMGTIELESEVDDWTIVRISIPLNWEEQDHE